MPGIKISVILILAAAKISCTPDFVGLTFSEVDRRCSFREWQNKRNTYCVQIEPQLSSGGLITVAQGSVCIVDDIQFQCSRGQWETHARDRTIQRKQRGVIVAAAVGAILCFIFCSEPTIIYVTNLAPVINCTSDLEFKAPRGNTEVFVSWKIPTAVDPDSPGNQPVEVEQIGGPKPNANWSEGVTSVIYKAADAGGATSYCTFMVTVKVTRCIDPPFINHGIRACQPKQINIYGAQCLYTCEAGYELLSGARNDTLTCQADATWDKEFPVCQPISCGDPGNLTDGSYTCPGGTVYPELCYVSCRPGYRQTSGLPFIRCDKDGMWTATQNCTDVEPPKFLEGCPANMALYSGPLQAAVKVNWTDPNVTDNSGLPIVMTTNLEKGTFLGLGFHIVRLTATDEAGNAVSCNFVITIEAKSCFPPIVPASGSMTCTMGYVEGSQCTTVCNTGYDIEGNETLSCLYSRKWNATEPKCKAVVCDQPPAIDNGFVDCPNNYQYLAVCSVRCASNYQLREAGNIQCQANRTWTKAGYCYDNSPPDFPNGCTSNIEVYASRLGLPNIVTWSPPAVRDNSGLNISLETSISPGSTFPLGGTSVIYTATDINGNSRSCTFTITVTTLTCGQPSTSQSSYLLYACPDGYVHGAVCIASCTNGFPLTGSRNISCERHDTSSPPTMIWTAGTAGDPDCQETNCTSLTPPANGALSCWQGNFAKECLMSCQANWDVPRYTDGRFVCPNTLGIWTPSTVPNCTVRHLPGKVHIMSELYYFTGSCPNATEYLKETFIQRVTSSQWGSACASTPSCRVENVEITCGSISDRRKRQTSEVRELFAHVARTRRQAGFYLRFTVNTAFDYEETASQKPDAIYSHYMTVKDEIYAKLQEDADNGHFDLSSSLTTNARSVVYPSINTDCPAGTTFKDTITSSSFSCVGCYKGFFLVDPQTGCGQCPVGTYSDIDNATVCTPCPAGYSTAFANSSSFSECKQMCPPGYVSHDGFFPCQPCPPGTFQSRERSKTCDVCPAGTWTTGNASDLNECLSVDVHLASGSSLVVQNKVSGTALRLRFYVFLEAESVVHCKFFGFSQMSVYVSSSESSSTLVPINGSVRCQTNKWCRLDLTLNPSLRTATLYYKLAAIFMEAPSASFSSISLNITAIKGTALVSGLHGEASTGPLSAANTSQCHGPLTTNLLSWAPQPSMLQAPSTCDAFDDCQSSPCAAHGSCLNLQDGFLCQCQDGWGGDTCHDPPSPCYNHQCQNGATCLPDSSKGGNYSCLCKVPFSGSKCELLKIHGRWGEWSAWENCSALCGGQQKRRRLCNNPTPANGGNNCVGLDTELQACGQPNCPVPGHWGAWDEWSACSSSCEGGGQTRHRPCDSPVPQFGGDYCSGQGMEIIVCNNITCPVNGKWSEWSDWTACSVTCGLNGTRSRQRTCDSPAPASGGDYCRGAGNETDQCGQQPCPECNRESLRRGVGTIIACQESISPKLTICNLTCIEGFATVRALPLYICGEATGYLWSGQRNISDIVILPACTVPTTAQAASFNQTLLLDAGCEVESSRVQAGIQQNLQSLPCVANGCEITVSVNCLTKTSGTLTTSKSKTSESQLAVVVRLEMLLGKVSSLGSEITEETKKYINVLKELDESALLIARNGTQTLFSVDLNGVDIQPDMTSISYTAKLHCARGSISVSGYCVHCPEGRMEVDGRCELCPLGQYQDELGQTSCKNCPLGTTWGIAGADRPSLCVYALHSPPGQNTTSEDSRSDGKTDNNTRVGLIVGLTVAAVAIVVIIALTVAVLRKYGITDIYRILRLSR